MDSSTNSLRHLESPAVDNDDEEERRRRRTVFNESIVSFNSELEHNESLRYAVQLYTDNKLDKTNAWNVNIISTFAKLISKHSSRINFKLVGPTLEASAKVYAMRVDSVHSDVMSLYNDLVRQNINNPQKQNKNNNEDINDENNPAPAAPVKKKRVKRRTYIARDDQIYAPLETVPFEIPFFAKQRTLVGDMLSSQNLMQNTLMSENSALDIFMNKPFFREDYLKKVDFDETTNNEKIRKMQRTTVPIIKPHGLLHKTLANYAITDQIDEDDSRKDDFYMDDYASNDALSSSAIGLHFDIDAAVEPIPEESNHMIMADFVEDVFDNDTCDEERVAVAGCRGLQRQQHILEDMRPIDNTILEYSYRPLDHINQYWAGPSHWKYKPLRSSHLPLENTIEKDQLAITKNAATKQKQRPKKKKNLAKIDNKELLELVSSNVFVTVNPNKPLKSITLSKTYINKRWDSKKLKLPTDLKLEREMFDVYMYTPSQRVIDYGDDTNGIIPQQDSVYENASDREDDMNNGAFNDDDYDNGFVNDNNQPNNTINVNNDHSLMEGTSAPNDLNMSSDHISEHLADAPEKVAKITIAYSKKPKRVDMKLLKARSWQIMNGEKSTEMSFSKVMSELPKTDMSQEMKKNLSPALVFYSILHLANEKGLKLEQNENLSDIKISPYNYTAEIDTSLNEGSGSMSNNN